MIRDRWSAVTRDRLAVRPRWNHGDEHRGVVRLAVLEDEQEPEHAHDRRIRRPRKARTIAWRLELAADHDVADGHSLEAVLRCGVGRDRFNEAFLFVRTNRNDDFVGRKGRKSVADGEIDVRLPGNGVDGVARKLLGRALGDTLGMTERFLVVGEPVEQALPYDRHHDLDRVGLPDMRPKNVVRMLNGADDENVPAHDRNVPHGPKVLSVEARFALRTPGSTCSTRFVSVREAPTISIRTPSCRARRTKDPGHVAHD
jgi:hypothetical protein